MPAGDYGTINSNGLEPLYRDGQLLCGARKPKRGDTRCQSIAGAGTDHPGYGSCKYHSGSTSAGVTAAARQEITDRIDEMKRLGVVNDNIGPEEALLQEVSRAAAAVAYFDDAVAKIPQDETWFGPNQVIIAQWNEQRTLLRQTAKAIVAAGIAKRQVEIAEIQAKMLVKVLLAVVGAPEMALDAQQQSIARKLMAVQLRGLTAIEATSAA